ncbi:MAG TPA: transposase [Ktedonobacteraceae bacterium]|nr:transposase [Ktedonobacteraceae bacterium]
MAKATTTIRQVANTARSSHAAWFAATQTLFNQIAAFYFQVIQAHEAVLDLPTKEALTALEKLTHATKKNPHPVMPLAEVAAECPAYFRRAAIHAALGSARSFYTHLSKWRREREKAQAKGKKFSRRPPVPPRQWNKSTVFYAGQWKEREGERILLKVWTGSVWSWVKVRLTGRDLPEGVELGSPSLVRRGGQWWLHTPVERSFKAPAKVEEQVTTVVNTKICAIDLNLDKHLAVCTVQTVEGTILATRFIGGGQEISGFRKFQLGRIARNRSRTGLIEKGPQDNADLWQKIRNADENLSHLVSARIVQFAKRHQASILVFEHLGKLRPERGKYSKRGNSKRAFWMKGRIFQYSKYKAWQIGIITSRVNPRNTSRECSRCGAAVARYQAGHEAEGYTPGAPLVLCPSCGMKGHADKNASLVIGKRLVERFKNSTQEKPPTPLLAERESQDSGGEGSHAPETEAVGHSSLSERHGILTGHGTAQNSTSRMVEPVREITTPLRPQVSRSHAPSAPGSADVGVSEAPGLPGQRECHTIPNERKRDL